MLGVIVIILNIVLCLLNVIEAATSEKPSVPAIQALLWGTVAVINMYILIHF